MDADFPVRANRRGKRSREQVLDAAEALMADYGYDGATLPRIVELSGIPLSSIYHYFGSKEGILSAVMQRGALRLAAAVPSAPAETDPLTALTMLLDHLRAEMEAYPQFFSLVIATADTAADDNSKLTGMARDIRDLGLHMLRDRIADVFDPRPADKDAEELARFVRAAIDGALLAARADRVPLTAILAHLPTAVMAIYEQQRRDRKQLAR